MVTVTTTIYGDMKKNSTLYIAWVTVTGGNLTLSERNAFFKAGIAFCAAVTLLVTAASLLTIPIYPTMEENTRRPANFFQLLTGWLFATNYFAVHLNLVLAVVFSLVTMCLIHAFFERTSAPEILYISFFAISLSFEVVRLALPLRQLYDYPSLYLLIAARLLLFARFFGLFSLFIASVCATGLEVQKSRNIILILGIAVLAITLGVPIDTQSWDTCFRIINGYGFAFRVIEAVAFAAAAAGFFVAVKVRGSKEYAYVGIGVILAFAGRNILLGADSWAGPAPGILLLAFGTWFICSKLHKIHLWL
jgi:hypothetical protein